MMNYCNIIPKIYIKNGKLVENGHTCRELELKPVSLQGTGTEAGFFL